MFQTSMSDMEETAEKCWSSLQAAAPRTTNTLAITAVKKIQLNVKKLGIQPIILTTGDFFKPVAQTKM